MKLLALFPSLHIKPGFELRAYLYRVDGNGNGFVFAVPEGAPLRGPNEFLTEETSPHRSPKPPEALADFRQAIEGDGSPESYFEASFFTREAYEFGAVWHGSSWGSHKILTSNPCEESGCPHGLNWRDLAVGRVNKTMRGLHEEIPTAREQWNALKAEAGEKAALRKEGDEEPTIVEFRPIFKHEIPNLWTWRKDIPETWQPSVSFSDDQVAVSFYTYSGLDISAIYQWSDLYKRGSYQYYSQIVRHRSWSGWLYILMNFVIMPEWMSIQQGTSSSKTIARL